MVINTKGKKVWRKGKYEIIVGNASPGEVSKKLGATLIDASIQLK